MRGRWVMAAPLGLAVGLWASGSFAGPNLVPVRDPSGAGKSLHAGLMLDADGTVVSVDTLSPTDRSFELTQLFMRGGGATEPFAYQSDPLEIAGHWVNTAPSASVLVPSTNSRPFWSLRDVRLSARLSPELGLEAAEGRNLGAVINPLDLADGGYYGLFLSGAALHSPYLAAADGGAYTGLVLAPVDNFRIRLGQATLGQGMLADPHFAGVGALPTALVRYLGTGGRSAQTTAGSFELNLGGWAGIDLTASHTSEAGGLLGAVNGNVVTNSADTNALGISARVGFGAGWETTMSYSEGVSHLNLRHNDLLTGASELKSQAYGLAIAKQGVFGDDALGIAVSRPLQVYGGNGGFSSAIAGDGLLVFTNPRTDFSSSSAPESDIELGYVTTFLDGAVALQANAAYQVNARGERGQDAVSLLSRAKINF